LYCIFSIYDGYYIDFPNEIYKKNLGKIWLQYYFIIYSFLFLTIKLFLTYVMVKFKYLKIRFVLFWINVNMTWREFEWARWFNWAYRLMQNNMHYAHAHHYDRYPIFIDNDEIINCRINTIIIVNIIIFVYPWYTSSVPNLRKKNRKVKKGTLKNYHCDLKKSHISE